MKKTVPYSGGLLPFGARYLFLALIWFIPGLAFSQNTVTGTVSSELTGETLPGVNVLIKGSSTGTVTDMEGNYSINVTDAESLLVFSFIGFVSQEVPINGRSIIDVSLAEDMASLDEVVVVGYGEQKKATLTGSIASISGEEIMRAPTPNLSNSLAGLMPGLVAMNRSGKPGDEGSTFLIRGNATTGNNTPLVLVDGIPEPGWERINPN